MFNDFVLYVENLLLPGRIEGLQPMVMVVVYDTCHLRFAALTRFEFVQAIVSRSPILAPRPAAVPKVQVGASQVVDLSRLRIGIHLSIRNNNPWVSWNYGPTSLGQSWMGTLIL